MKSLDDLKKLAKNFTNISSIATAQTELLEIHNDLENIVEESDSKYLEQLVASIDKLREENILLIEQHEAWSKNLSELKKSDKKYAEVVKDFNKFQRI